MAARRASVVRLLKVLQHSGNGPPVAPSYVASRPVAVSSFPFQIPSVHVESSFGRTGVISFRRLYAADGEASRDLDEHEQEKAKMTSEGGGTQLFGEAKENLKAKSQKTAATGKSTLNNMADKAHESAQNANDMMHEKTEQGEGVMGSMKDQVTKEADTAKDMFRDFPQKTSETAQGIKEVVVEAAKAVKRDAEKVAHKVGFKSEEKH